jgi:L-aspartate oxidase
MEEKYPELGNLMPRDVVSREIYFVTHDKTLGGQVYLDMRDISKETWKKRLPDLRQEILDYLSIDSANEPVPVEPGIHYFMGGIDVDTKHHTNIENLYAAGECSNTGVHGNNRLASNSLLEALVFSRQAALDIAEKLPTVPDTFTEATFPEMANTKPMPKGTRTEIRQIMQDSFFVIPNQAELLKGFERIKEIRRMLYNEPFAVTPDLIEAKAMATNAYLILKEVL